MSASSTEYQQGYNAGVRAAHSEGRKGGILLTGTYAEDATDYGYVCRVFPWGHYGRVTWRDGVGRPVTIGDDDILKIHGDGSWAALYRKK